MRSLPALSLSSLLPDETELITPERRTRRISNVCENRKLKQQQHRQQKNKGVELADTPFYMLNSSN